MEKMKRKISVLVIIALIINIFSINGLAANNITLKSNKTEYEYGEDIYVSATGGTSTAWVGIYNKGDKPGTSGITSIYWYYLTDANPGEEVVIQDQRVNGNRRALPKGEYEIHLFNDGYYDIIKTIEIEIKSGDDSNLASLMSIEYDMDDPTSGYANGEVIVKISSGGMSNLDCVMYWADENYEPLKGYTPLAKFKIKGEKTVHEMYDYTIIPEGAKTLIAYTSYDGELSDNFVATELPNGCNYIIGEDYLAEFQLISDIHITAGSATSSVANKHFSQMLNDVAQNSPKSMGIFVNGDIADNGLQSQYETLVNIYSDAQNNMGDKLPELHMAIGNHDWMNGNPNSQFQYYAKLLNSNLSKQPDSVYYDEVVNGYNFIYLGGETNGTSASLSSKQLNWLDTRLSQITTENPDKPIFILLHQPLYNTVAGSLSGQGWHGVNNEQNLRNILKKYDQAIIAGGHSHWELDSEMNMFAGADDMSVAVNTASVAYLWSSYNVTGGEHADGSNGYYVRIYDDKIIFMGRDFENSQFVSSAIFVVKQNKIETEKKEYTMLLGDEELDLNISALDDTNIKFESQDTSVATVSQSGIVSPNKTGKVDINITAYSNGKYVIDKETVTVYINNNHRMGEWQETKAASCTEDGLMTRQCKDCDYYETKDIVSSGHDLVTDKAKEPTCTEKGLTAGEHCKNCEYVILQEEIKENGHLWDDGKITLEPTYDALGIKLYECKNCEETYIEYLPKLIKNGVTRIYGDNRYETAIKTADVLKDELGVLKFSNIVIASGDSFADALSGAYLAAKKNAPILLVSNSYYQTVLNYIDDNWDGKGTIYVLGGTTVIPDHWMGNLNFKRCGGEDRFETNLAILKEAGLSSYDQIMVCSGMSFADSLSVSSTGNPVLLVDENLTKSQIEYLANLRGEVYNIIGGTAAVSETIYNECDKLGTTIRIFGNNRYETCIEVAKAFFKKPTGAVLAYALNYPDGLSAGPLAYNLNVPLILTNTSNSNDAKEYAQSKEIIEGYVIGGPMLIDDKSVKEIFNNDSLNTV